MRKQYHFRPSPNGYYAWDIDRLVMLSSRLTPQRIRLDEINEIDENYWFDEDDKFPTCRSIAEHARLIEESDLGHPIIMCSNRRIMDGMHRVLKALNTGEESVEAVVFDQDPELDYIDVFPDDLPY